MLKMRKTLFISDIHLAENRPDITMIFLNLLNQLDHSIDALYILGDFFDAWIGDDHHTPFHQTIKQNLRHVTQKGISVYLLHGNRDFLIGNQFLNETGCVLLPEESYLSLYGTPVLIMHGDTLCTNDHAYLRARKLARNRFLQWVFLKMPLSFRIKLAEKLRAKSVRYTQSVQEDILDVTQKAVEKVMQKHQVCHLIHGHTHKPNTHSFTINGTPATRRVLAPWHTCGSVLVWGADGTITVESQSANGL